MSDSQSLSRQQKIGGIAGILLLAFALAYRFFPVVLLGNEHASTAPVGASGQVAPMGFGRAGNVAPVAAFSEARVGPPVSLASSEVIMAYRRAANAPVSAQLAEWLGHGDKAVTDGKLAGSDDSAASWYGKVLEADEDNRAARAGLAEVARKLASRAQTALTRGDGKQASQLLDELRGVPLADTEVARLEQRIAMVAKVTPMLGQAADLLQQPPVSAAQRTQALALYRDILKLDPDNSVAHQGLLKIQRYWLDGALSAIAKNDYAGADEALAKAADVEPASRALQNARSRVEGMRRLQAGNLLAQARSALDSGDLALATTLANQAVVVSPDVPGIDDFNAAYRNAKLYGGRQPGQLFFDRFADRVGRGPALVVLPIGHFRMGAEDGHAPALAAALPAHEVVIDRGIAMARTEVSVSQFRDFINASGYRTDAERLGSSSVYDLDTGRMHDQRGADWQRDFAGNRVNADEPVVSVSWNDAAAYAKWLSERTGQHYRLPSEAEFEYALRAGTTTPYWWGDGAPTAAVENLTGTRDRARNGRRWVRAFADYGDGYWGPAPVGHFKPNPFGLYDMAGNVSEWVEDCWHDNYTRAPHDGRAWVNPGCDMRVVRGGSWGSAPEQVRASFRIAAKAATRGGRVGFRVVRDPGTDPGQQIDSTQAALP